MDWFCYTLAAAGTTIGLLFMDWRPTERAPKTGKAFWSIVFGLVWPFTLALVVIVSTAE